MAENKEESMMINPLPCPFCGGEVSVYKLNRWDNYYISCYNDCEVNPRIDRPSSNEEEVISRWNKRKEQPCQDIV